MIDEPDDQPMEFDPSHSFMNIGGIDLLEGFVNDHVFTGVANCYIEEMKRRVSLYLAAKGEMTLDEVFVVKSKQKVGNAFKQHGRKAMIQRTLALVGVIRGISNNKKSVIEACKEAIEIAQLKHSNGKEDYDAAALENRYCKSYLKNIGDCFDASKTICDIVSKITGLNCTPDFLDEALQVKEKYGKK